MTDAPADAHDAGRLGVQLMLMPVGLGFPGKARPADARAAGRLGVLWPQLLLNAGRASHSLARDAQADAHHADQLGIL